jgi:hypothetical protein
MATVTVEPAHPRHINRIANRMREADRIEAAAWGHTPKAALRGSLRASTVAWTAMADGVPVAMFGVAPISAMDRLGTPWMLGTDDVEAQARAVLRLGPRFLAAIEREFPRLENRVSADNHVSIGWLRRLGFAFDDEIVYVRGVAFRRFHKGL